MSLQAQKLEQVVYRLGQAQKDLVAQHQQTNVPTLFCLEEQDQTPRHSPTKQDTKALRISSQFLSLYIINSNQNLGQTLTQ
jgi:hypothetical protein